MSEVKINLGVKGMTCNHCAASVREELEEIDSVNQVEVELKPEAISQVTVTSNGDVSDDALRDAITEAGYELVAIER